MRQCPNCEHKNPVSSQTCEICGAALAASAPQKINEMEYANRGASTTAAQIQIPGYQHLMPLEAEQPLIVGEKQVPTVLRRAVLRRGIIHTLFCLLLSLYGFFWVLIGIFGIVPQEVQRTALFAVPMWIVYISGFIAPVLVLMFYRRPRFHWWQRILWSVIFTTFMVVATTVGYLVLDRQYNGEIPAAVQHVAFGVMYFVYGLGEEFVALW